MIIQTTTVAIGNGDLKKMPTESTNPQEYRPAIDGLRAVAILSVFLFHLKSTLLPGGFVGVDVFFVISGYLITSIIFRQCQQNRFSLAQFYQRRIARIFPAFFTVASVTLLAAYFIYSAQDFASAGANLTAASLSIANIKYMFQGNYFAISPDAQPFLHYWSLSVEEQFYMVFPVALALIYRKTPRLTVPILTIVTIISFVACVAMTIVRPSWAFYLLPTRAWELSAGALLAIKPEFSHGLPRNCRRWLSLTGLILIATSFVFVTEERLFPGYQALLPVIGAVLVLIPSKGIVSPGESLLSLGLATFIGRISYSLYLWHWPVFSMVDYHLYASPETTRIFLKVVISLSASFLSYKLIESPLRSLLNQNRNRNLAFASVAVIIVACVSIGIGVRRANFVNAELSDVARGGLVFNKSSNSGTIVLMGDSNGSMYGKLLKNISAELGLKLIVTSVAAGNPLPANQGPKRPLWIDSLATVEKAKPDIVFLVCAWENKLQDNKDQLALALKSIKPYTRFTILITQPPILPEKATRSAIRGGVRPPFIENPGQNRSRIEANNYVKSMKSESTLVIDIESYFEKENKEIKISDDKGRLLYHDSTHLSDLGTFLIKRDILYAIKIAALPRSGNNTVNQ